MVIGHLHHCMSVMDLPALQMQYAVFTHMTFVQSLAMWQHCTSLMSIQISCRILLPCPWYNFAQNVITSPATGSD